VAVDTEAIGPVLLEVTRVNIPIGVVERAGSLGHPVPPVAIVLCPISPDLHALAVPHEDVGIATVVIGLLHLAGVDGALAGLVVFLKNNLVLVDVIDDLPLVRPIIPILVLPLHLLSVELVA